MITKVKLPRVVPLLLVCLFSWSETRAADFFESFERDPLAGAWRTFGDASLFAWDEAASNLKVTWDSRKPNSYLQLPLGAVLNRRDTFTCEFDLTIHDLELGVTDGRPFTFQLAAGFQRMSAAQDPEFVRGTGTGATNLVEFNYFPDSGFGATVWPVAVDENGGFNFNGGGDDYVIQELPLNQPLRVMLGFDAALGAVILSVNAGETELVPTTTVPLDSSFTDFAVDAFAISSYSDTGADGSLLARGTIDNLRLSYALPVENLAITSAGEVTVIGFDALGDWTHQLQRSTDFDRWDNINEPLNPADSTAASIHDPQPPSARAFYRIESTRP